MGDMNDGPSSVVVNTLCGGGPTKLLRCAERVPIERRDSVIHRGRGEQIDHILVSEVLFERLREARFVNETLRDHGPYPQSSAPSLDSDHAPFVVSFD